MSKVQDKVTRFSADLVDAAAAEGLRQSRSARQQLDHWVRVGKAVSGASTAQRARVEAALSGQVPFGDLSGSEAVAVHAELDAAIEAKVASTRFGVELRRDGITTVALDDDGRLIQYLPDGSSSVLDPAS